MANTFLTPQIVAREAMTVLQNNLVFANLVYRNTSSDFVNGVGDTVNVRLPQSIAARQFTGSAVDQDDVAELSVPVKLDHHMYVQIPVSTEDLSMNINNLSEQVIAPALIGHAQAIDAALAGLYADIYTYGTVAGTPAVSDIAAIGKLLSLNKVAFNGRNLVMDPTQHAKYIVLDAFLNADKRGGTGAIADAEIGRVLGLSCYEDQNVVTHTKGSNTAGSASGTAGASVVAIASCSAATATMKKGDIFTIADDAQTYVVTEDATASGSAIAALKIAPALKTSPSSKAITIVDTAKVNGLAFGPQAFCLATKPLPKPSGQAADIINYNGFSVRVVYGWDNTLLSDVVTIDMLWGVKTLDRARAVRLIG